MDDTEAMERCIELARAAMAQGNSPYGSVIVKDGRIVAEAANAVTADHDPTAHAETAAVRTLCRSLGTRDLRGYSIYASGEPCWMCSTVIREVGLSRVVIGALSRSGTGGFSSAYPILRVEVVRFGPPPEVVTGILAAEVEALLAEAGQPGFAR